MRFRIPPLNTLRLFEAAGRARSFAEAARDTGVTASAVSHGIQSLEDWLGAALFARKRGQLSLTPAGAAYLAAVRDAFGILSTELPRRSHCPDRLRLTVVPTFAGQILVPRLPEFRRRYPDVSLSIDTSHKLMAFPGDGFDAGIRLGTGPWPGLFAQHLLTETLVAVAAPGLVAPGADFTALPDENLIYTTGTDDGWRDWADAFGRPPPQPERGLRVDTLQMALAAAAQGMGVALARMPSAAGAIRDGGLITLSDRPVPCRQSYWFVTAPDAAARVTVQALLGWLTEEMERMRANG